MNLRSLARGRECQVRIENVCSFNPEQTVLAHVRLIGVSGMGSKASDLCAAWACFHCHTLCDTGQWNGQRYEREFCEISLLRAVIRTQTALVKEGVLKW